MNIKEPLMSQHVSLACDEGTWVPLIEYSIKSGLSLSTIRRKIKSNSIPYRLDKGKYFILFSNGTGAPEVPAVNAGTRQVAEPRPVISPRYTDRKLTANESEASFETPKVPYRPIHKPEPVAPHADFSFERLMQEKEERIRLLEKRNSEMAERINELQLLIKVLEEKYDVRY